MASVASTLAHFLPKPKYAGQYEEIPSHAQPKGPRVVGKDAVIGNAIALRVSFPACELASKRLTLS